MVEGQRAVQKRGVKVRLRGVAGVIGLGEEAEVGQTEPSGQNGHLPQVPGQAGPAVRGMDEHQADEKDVEDEAEKENGRSSHGRRSMSLTVSAVTSENRSTERPLWSLRKVEASRSAASGMSSRPIGPTTSLPTT